MGIYEKLKKGAERKGEGGVHHIGVGGMKFSSHLKIKTEKRGIGEQVASCYSSFSAFEKGFHKFCFFKS